MKVLLATALKPITDPRMSEKLAQIFGRYNAEIHIFGRKTSNVKHTFTTHPAPITSRKLGGRLGAQYHFARTIRALRPDCLVVGAIELLWVAFLLKPFFGYKLIYDIRENYRRNIWYQSVYASWQKPILIIWIVFTEWLSRYIVQEFWLAEACYAEELSFFKNHPYYIIENKFVGNPPLHKIFPVSLSGKTNIHFALVGTLSSTFGAMRAINFFEHYSKKYAARLTVIGMVADKEVSTQIEKLPGDNIKKITSEQTIPHEQIIEVMQNVDVVMLPYLPNKSTENCIPTKLYECLALGIPMLISHNPRWESVVGPYKGAVFTSFSPSEIESVFDALQKTDFYPDGYAKDAYFDVGTGLNPFL